MMHFNIVVNSYNNTEWTEYCLASILNQTYTNYSVIFVDDASTDNTLELATSIIGDDARFAIVHNDVNMGGTYNHMTQFNRIIQRRQDDNEVIVALDGDDWLFDIFVLEKLNAFYIDGDYWMTYGGMYVYAGSDNVVEGAPQNTPHDLFTHEHNLYRKDAWRASHLRTWKTHLIKKFNDTDIRELETGNYYWQAADLALQFACLEMCPSNKIGVVDFPTYIYNATPSNSSRTSNRQYSSDSWKIESEIRSRKHYSTLGTPLPQLNVFGYNYETDFIPKTFTIEYGLLYGEYDAILLTDFDIPRFINGEVSSNNKPVIADLHESREYSSDLNVIYDMVYDNANMFSLILTHDSKLLTLPNANKRLIMWKTHLSQYRVQQTPGERKMQDESLRNMYQKTKNISCISSNKSSLPGHKFRLELVNGLLSDTSVSSMFDMYGVGFNEIPAKIDGLRDYRFSIVVENAYLDNWATEKISDCFHTGTIPIYYGCPNIGTMFDLNGILTFDTLDDLKTIIKRINEDGDVMYNHMLPSVHINFMEVTNYSMNLDEWFTKYIRPII